jgi:hypothetical protein
MGSVISFPNHLNVFDKLDRMVCSHLFPTKVIVSELLEEAFQKVVTDIFQPASSL